ncbi:MAG: glutamate-5-semialdehyde dehydrogenase [Candidatus Omnitrophica bacterium]|nr:glutamate-5-semialdehyde dehydrogenase [Candidatus Omnitrophota bacterium]
MNSQEKLPRTLQIQIDRQLKNADAAKYFLQRIPAKAKDKILKEAAREIERSEKKIIRENAKDLKQARRDGLSPAMIDRLTLTPARIKTMADGVRVVAGLEHPVGRVLSSWKRPNQLKISKVVVPLGVILIIYESRPNVTVECAALCLKSANAVILRGGREAFYSNRVLVAVFEKVLTRYGVPKAAVSMIQTTERRVVDYLLKQDHRINLVIPRGGETLIRKVVEQSRIPVIKHYKGICHVYIDKGADLKKGLQIALNAKVQRPGVCNAMETLLVHRKAAAGFLPALGEKLAEAGCEIRGDAQTCRFIPKARKARAGDYGYEFLDKILAVKVVNSLDDALEHIRIHGSGHTDAIVTRDAKAARIFKNEVDSSSVMVNASTRFADGFEYGFGAEIGISTDKIHARGPMGLEGLTSYKYVVEGNGQVRK